MKKKKKKKKKEGEEEGEEYLTKSHFSPNISCVYIDRRNSTDVISHKLMCENSILTSYYLGYLRY